VRRLEGRELVDEDEQDGLAGRDDGRAAPDEAHGQAGEQRDAQRGPDQRVVNCGLLGRFHDTEQDSAERQRRVERPSTPSPAPRAAVRPGPLIQPALPAQATQPASPSHTGTLRGRGGRSARPCG
jgi:hypothetical protein